VNKQGMLNKAKFRTAIDLTNPKTFVSIERANRATQANSA